MRRVLLCIALTLIVIASIWLFGLGRAHAQELSAGETFVGQRMGQDAVVIKRLLDENAALKAENAKLKADAEQAKAPKP